MRAQLLYPLVPVALFLFASCKAGTRPEVGSTMVTSSPLMMQKYPLRSLCPLDVPGTRVTVSDLGDSVGVMFDTRAHLEYTRELRARVGYIAKMRNALISQEMGARDGRVIRAFVENVEAGARIKFIPWETWQIPALLVAVRQDLARMRAGDCP